MMILSLGAGVQSTTLALLAKHRILPRPRAAVFADTGNEPKAVYTHLNWLEGVLDYLVIRASYGNLGEDCLQLKYSEKNDRVYQNIRVPMFTLAADGKKGMMPRQCTRAYKIDMVNAACRRLLKKRQIRATEGILVHCWIGISTDEAHRMKPSQVPWIRKEYPLIDLGMSRADCIQWCADHGYPQPPRSGCTFCPYHSDEEWLRLRSEAPDEFQGVVEWERKMREQNLKSEAMTSDIFVHSQRVPLDQVIFKTGANEGQFGNECEGMCGA